MRYARTRVSNLGVLGVLTCFLFFAAPAALGQRLAVLTPENSERSAEYADRIAARLSSAVRIQDASLTDAAFRSVTIRDPFNMSVAEGRSVAAAVGCDYVLVIRAGASRRSSFARPEYYEAFAILYLVSGRTGNLLLWRLASFDGHDQSKADERLTLSIEATTSALVAKMKTAARTELAVTPIGVIEEVPIEGTPAAVDFKPPIPYRRIKPAYTETAFLYDVRATVEIEADIGSDGSVLSTRAVRWAGFGLEESAETAVRAMTWRPAVRNGKPLPMRVLLRYNFTKLDKE